MCVCVCVNQRGGELFPFNKAYTHAVTPSCDILLVLVHVRPIGQKY